MLRKSRVSWVSNLSISLKSTDGRRPSAEIHLRNSNTFHAAAMKRSASVRSAALVSRNLSGVEIVIVALARRSACVIAAEVHWTNPSNARNCSSSRDIGLLVMTDNRPDTHSCGHLVAANAQARRGPLDRPAVAPQMLPELPSVPSPPRVHPTSALIRSPQASRSKPLTHHAVLKSP